MKVRIIMIENIIGCPNFVKKIAFSAHDFFALFVNRTAHAIPIFFPLFLLKNKIYFKMIFSLFLLLWVKNQSLRDMFKGTSPDFDALWNILQYQVSVWKVREDFIPLPHLRPPHPLKSIATTKTTAFKPLPKILFSSHFGNFWIYMILDSCFIISNMKQI